MEVNKQISHSEESQTIYVAILPSRRWSIKLPILYVWTSHGGFLSKSAVWEGEKEKPRDRDTRQTLPARRPGGQGLHQQCQHVPSPGVTHMRPHLCALPLKNPSPCVVTRKENIRQVSLGRPSIKYLSTTQTVTVIKNNASRRDSTAKRSPRSQDN